ncbi:metalloregulator ArsR/SmtB family transcription factor [Pseudomonas sp. MUP55]|uniref:helix-turn-helix transcriptional regulator n=1 Tax=Pseudomonas sp. MUP55 TaxID=3087234 RepID=UPI002A59DDA0|nr:MULTISPECIES: metalloregulator ArsR/SmtB family transcription factor [unclassified Pseudomonas]WPN90378.1 metalloregulator ArsR/SmtB family transcription factor [Pseudomonas sp. MUP56]WPN95903.1 metalloregulator ArsR/SmtB family transcription factor [Pseudomonas sp. MUP55]
MTSKPADDTQPSTAERILFLLKTRGPLKTTELASLLEVTFEAARQQIQKLQASELIVGVSAPTSGAGRPSLKWALTDTAHNKFPDSHSVLTLHLIESIEGVFGSDGIEKIITSMEATNRQEYVQACSQASSLEEKVAILVRIRELAGYMAHMEPAGEGWLLIENHCPICAAARKCQGFCRSELQIFRAAMGDDALVERCEHLISGDRRCVYNIQPRA